MSHLIPILLRVGILFYQYLNTVGGHGGIGRRAGFRFQWATVQVQVLLSARINKAVHGISMDSLFYLIGNYSEFPIKQKRSAMDAHSRVRYMLHKCNRARREHVASNMLFYM